MIITTGVFFAVFAIIGPPASGIEIEKVVDGDSLFLEGSCDARLIGVDAPEYKDHKRNRKNAYYYGVDLKVYESYAKKSEDFVRSLVEGREIVVEYDDANIPLGHEDKYGRMLVYIWIPEGSFAEEELSELIASLGHVSFDEGPEGHIQLNALVIAGGYGAFYRRFPTKYAKEFDELEVLAKKSQRGFWD